MAVATNLDRFRRSVFTTMFVVGMSLFLTATVVAAPNVNLYTPWALVRGEQVNMVIKGGNLADPTTLLLYREGVEVLELKNNEAGEVVASLKIADDCPVGHHSFRLATQNGVSRLRQFVVSALPRREEQEPNGNLDQAELVEQGVTVQGVLKSEDADCFAVELKKGETLSVEVVAMRLGPELIDCEFHVFGPDGAEVAFVDDGVLTRQDPATSLTVPSDGRYVIRVREVNGRGNDRFRYAMFIGSFPRPTMVMPTGGAAGEKVTFRWPELRANAADAKSTVQQEFELPRDGRDFAEIHANTGQGIAPTASYVRVNDLQNVEEVEPNQFDNATVVPAPCAVNAVIQQAGDQDWFRFAAKKGQRFSIHAVARNPLRSPMDPVISLKKGDSTHITSNDDARGRDAYLDFNVPADGEYVVFVRDHRNRGGANFFYRLEIAEKKPVMKLAVPDRVYRVPTTVSIPRGNRAAFLVTVAKSDFNEPVEFEIGNPGAGLSFQTVPVPKSRDRMPVIITAAEDADFAGHLIPIGGKSRVGEQHVTGRFRQVEKLVTGRNNLAYWTHHAQRLAVAVTKPAPFRVELQTPSVPIVRDGQLDLIVNVERDEGFEGEVTLNMVYNPPGISSRGQVKIPKDKTSAAIPITANGNAALGVSPIVVWAKARHENVDYEVSTDFAELNVEDRIFNMEVVAANVEQGQQTELVVKLERLREFAGETNIQLFGMPPGTTSRSQAVKADTTEVRFPITAAADARPGRHRTITCSVKIQREDQVVTQNRGGGQLRVDRPLKPPTTNKTTTSKTTTKKATTEKASKNAANNKVSRAVIETSRGEDG